MRDKKFYEKYLPKGSTVSFQVGLQGAIIVNGMLAGKVDIGYVGDMPGIVATSHPDVRDIRLVSVLGLGYDQCNIFLVRNDAPQFSSPDEAIKWLNGKTVAVPKGSCTDRFAQAVFKRYNIQPSEYLNQSIEVITSGFRAGKLDAAVIWEPTASRIVEDKLARRVASGASVNERDGGFMVMPQALIQQRPDIVKDWLQAELDSGVVFQRSEERDGHRQDGGRPNDGISGKGVMDIRLWHDTESERRNRYADHTGLWFYSGRDGSDPKSVQVPGGDQEYQRGDPSGCGTTAIHRRYLKGAGPNSPRRRG